MNRARTGVPGALGLLFTLLTGLLSAPGNTAEAPLRLAVATNFRAAAELLGSSFAATHGRRVLISSASTGVLAAQLANGAPFDLLLAADRARPQALFDAGLALGDIECYALGSLTLLGDDSLSALSDARRSIAIANPRVAPYGSAAIAVLSREAFPPPTQRRIIRGSNVQQALQFYASGAADLALIATALSPDAGVRIPGDWHRPIEQFALVSHRSASPDLARQFLDHLLSDTAQDLLTSQGYRACS